MPEAKVAICWASLALTDPKGHYQLRWCNGGGGPQHPYRAGSDGRYRSEGTRTRGSHPVPSPGAKYRQSHCSHTTPMASSARTLLRSSFSDTSIPLALFSVMTAKTPPMITNTRLPAEPRHRPQETVASQSPAPPPGHPTGPTAARAQPSRPQPARLWSSRQPRCPAMAPVRPLTIT